MKTFFTIEIKDGRVQPLAPRITATPGSQRAEVTLGLRSTPIRITTIPSSVSSICNISSVSSNVTKAPGWYQALAAARAGGPLAELPLPSHLVPKPDTLPSVVPGSAAL
ncbi:hypothetical protein BTVI_37369 [Pitangus sulphuratus]|nr:hypothetical protein BTVI_37369 [Pitangus sulphuratus]